MKFSTKNLLLVAIVASIAIIATIHAAALTEEQAQSLFVEFAKRYEKEYEMSDYLKRFQIFKENANWVVDWNNDKKNTHTVAVNFFADMTPEEWNHYKGLALPKDWKEPDFAKFDKMKKDDPALAPLKSLLKVDDVLKEEPIDVDLRDQFAAVRNQGSCGSCYSFAAVGAMEGVYRLKTEDAEEKLAKDEFFSPQQGVDCTGPAYGCYYCQGGWPGNVMQYFAKNAVCNDNDYPYVSKRTKCQKCNGILRLSGHQELTGQPEAAIVKALAEGPVTVALVSALRPFMFYRSGILSNCGTTASSQPDHALILVGAHVDPNNPAESYVLIRNSWGGSWGEAGYVRLAYGKNMCKWRSDNHLPLLQGPTSTNPTTSTEPTTTEPTSTEPSTIEPRGPAPTGTSPAV